jgi:amino acid permease
MNLPLKDIKPNVIIIDYEWWAFIGILTLLVVLTLFFIYKALKTKKQENISLKKLKELNFNDSKKVAYEFSKYAREFVNESNQETFKKIEKKLTQYKYKPTVPPIDKDLEKEIKDFIRNIK